MERVIKSYERIVIWGIVCFVVAYLFKIMIVDFWPVYEGEERELYQLIF